MLRDLGAGQREHHQWLIRELAERGLHELDRELIAPLQILQHEQDRAGRALGPERRDECLAYLALHGLGIDGRSAGETVVAQRAEAAELCQEVHSPLGPRARERAAQALLQARALDLGRLVAMNAATSEHCI